MSNVVSAVMEKSQQQSQQQLEFIVVPELLLQPQEQWHDEEEAFLQRFEPIFSC